MKAAIVEQLEGPGFLRVGELELPRLGKGRVCIEVKFAGINFPDTLITRGKYQFQPEMPFAPGGEVSGVIKEVGEGVDDFKPGDRVVSGTSWGGFAQEVHGWAFNTHKLPENVAYVDSASTLMTHGTVLHALQDRAELKEGETLAILGASGGVGTAAIQLGKLMGAKVIACVSSRNKREYCEQLGADEALIYTPAKIKEQLKELTGGNGVNVIFDAVGGDYAEPAFRAIAPMGRYLVVGFAAGYVPAIPWNLPLLKSASIVGVFWGNFFRNFPEANKQNIQKLLNWVGDGSIKPQIDEIFPLEKAGEALQKIEQRKVKGKLLMEI
ncbi:MAG: NADPH:quinone oxidoreductase family protein [Bacteroidota bacterium]